MIRFASEILDKWVKGPDRKPLVMRGARQVGKTWLVRDFAKRQGLKLIELNFEKYPQYADLFSNNNPLEILKNIEAQLVLKIHPGSSCLFLDEIQAAPELLSKLRWFREEMPELSVITAGSLLEFALGRADFSMPVGRIAYFYLEPLSFFEFVLALGNKPMYEKLMSVTPQSPLPHSLHVRCMTLYRLYCLVGGMPETVQAWLDSNDMQSCIKIQHDLLATFRDDFHKYGGAVDGRLLHKILLSVAGQLGNKFIYSRVDPDVKIPLVKNSLTLLSQAKVCSKVAHTSGNGIPLGAESNDKFFKTLMVDIGLISAHLGLSLVKPADLDNMLLLNRGGLAEQFVGQQLRAAQAPAMDPQLFYWQRTGGRQGEIDYILQQGNHIVPVEVKSGAAGSMKSLHQFMAEKKLEMAVRLNANPPSVEDMGVKTTQGQFVNYRLLSLPLYLAGNVTNLLDSHLG